jgi:hypothetical protein
MQVDKLALPGPEVLRTWDLDLGPKEGSDTKSNIIFKSWGLN